jgi:hypothetical protein
MVKAASIPDQCASGERPQTQCSHINVLRECRIAREQNLESAVQTKAIDGVGANSSARRIGRFEQGDGQTGPFQSRGAA